MIVKFVHCLQNDYASLKSEILPPASSSLASGQILANLTGRERRGLQVRGASQDIFTAEAEEREAAALANRRTTRPDEDREFLGNRVPLRDVKLKHRAGEPILLGEGGYGRVSATLSDSLLLFESGVCYSSLGCCPAVATVLDSKIWCMRDEKAALAPDNYGTHSI